jgi:hypothetical protein
VVGTVGGTVAGVVADVAGVGVVPANALAMEASCAGVRDSAPIPP